MLAPPLLELRDLTRCYTVGSETIFALNQVDLAVETNDYMAIVGSSGSGKSTMMNIIGCLDQPTSGQYLLDSTLVSELNENQLSAIRNRKIGFIFQSFNLLPRASALRNVIQPLLYRPGSRAERIDKAERVLDRVGLLNRKNHLPNELSGGQRQRVAIARALVTEPSLLLADEPTGNLDSTTTADILRLFDTLHEDGQTVILVTHDDKIAARCHRKVTLRDGRIVPAEGALH
jgi:putative ABC transport system ATP-binding protein